MADERLTLALETLGAIEQSGVTADDLYEASQALRSVGKRWTVSNEKITYDYDESHEEALERSCRLYELADNLESIISLVGEEA